MQMCIGLDVALSGMLSGTRFIVPDKISISVGLDKIEEGQSVSKMSLIVRSVY